MCARVLLIVCLLGCGSCAGTPAKNTLFDALGGMPGITRIVEEFLFVLGDDPRILHFFADSNIDRFHDKLIEHICELSDGPCKYSGDSMSETHRGMAIREAHFNALVEDFILAMERLDIPVTAQNRLLARMAPLHAQIMAHPQP